MAVYSWYDCHINCPNCGSTKVDIDEFKIWFDESVAIIPVYCHDCGTTWNIVYKFDHNEEIDVLEAREEA